MNRSDTEDNVELAAGMSGACCDDPVPLSTGDIARVTAGCHGDDLCEKVSSNVDVAGNSDTEHCNSTASPRVELDSPPAKKAKLSKQMRKQERYETKIARQREMRKEKKMRRKKRLAEGRGITVVTGEQTQSTGSSHLTASVTQQETPPSVGGESESQRVTKKRQIQMVRERLRSAMVTGQRVCVDLSLDQWMSKAEQSRLAQQIGRLYGANRKSARPAHLYLCGLQRDSYLYRECVRKNSGFDNYILDISDKPVLDLFKQEEVVYLTPDSDQVLDTIDPDLVYVIGGLVDETVTKNITLSSAQKLGLRTARLPIDTYMEKSSAAGSPHSKVLSVNQVFEILLEYTCTEDWGRALTAGVPPRKGYILKSH